MDGKPSDLERLRHSLAHLLAAAVKELWPSALPTIGPAIDNGFYYDFDFPTTITENDLEKIEAKMREILPTWSDFKKIEVSAQEARDHFSGNQYKIELIDELEKSGEPITLYQSGEFTDLCRGGHIGNMKNVPPDSWKLDRLAGAYWRGDENNKMLTRIYGLAFETKNDLDGYLSMLEEARKRDHRKIGTEMDLFTFSPLVGPGLPLWTPRGTVIRHELDKYVWELREKRGYERVAIPHLTKKDLYETSGHWQKFAEELFKIETREGKLYCLKPMNCPHHTQIYAHAPRSYRDLPQRYAETTMVYRDEQSGELGGLTRVLSITQDDAHVFCRMNQIRDEFFSVWDIIDTFYKTFAFSIRVRLSFHDPDHMDKYLGTSEIWQKAEAELENLAKERGADYVVGRGEAAMYGPKLDFLAKDSIGREHQVATIQLDMNMPERFDLTCINEKGEKERIVMIHCAIMGSIERFSAVLIEHLGGNFPVWLSPVQVIILPVGEAHKDYADQILINLKALGVRAEINTDESLGKRIREAKLQRVPYVLVVGDKEKDSDSVTVETRGQDSGEQMKISAFAEKITEQIKERKD